ncbi:MAG: hypothetical protein FWD12_13185 [Alphaproteobacteria bacterium]|nr:hypothetical protein [Alphaproteobacteria bacterium]
MVPTWRHIGRRPGAPLFRILTGARVGLGLHNRRPRRGLALGLYERPRLGVEAIDPCRLGLGPGDVELLEVVPVALF